MKFSRGIHVSLLLATALLFAVRASAQVAPAPKSYVPLEPTDLFAVLPAAEPGWKIVESKARNMYSGWLMAVVNRQYEGPPVPATDPAGAKDGNTNAKTTITLSDTGAFPAFNGTFLAASPSASRLTVGGFPALKDTTQPAGVESVQVWIGGRFIIKIVTERQPASAVAEWLKKIKTADLAAAATQGGNTLANPVTIYKIDELNPKTNRSYKLSWTTSEALEAANKP